VEKTVRNLIEDRIRDQVPGLREVKGAASYLALEEGVLLDDSAYVVKLIRKPSENQTCGGFASQNVQETYAVFVSAKNVRTVTGADAADQAETRCAQIQAALLGWQPIAGADILTYAGGQLVDERAKIFIWRELYTLSRPIQSETE
jgi:hypothetical protein